jgi:hypothetical protein
MQLDDKRDRAGKRIDHFWDCRITHTKNKESEQSVNAQVIYVPLLLEGELIIPFFIIPERRDRHQSLNLPLPKVD